MKKLIFFILVILILLFSGCKEIQEPKATLSTAETQKAPRQETWFETKCKEECKEDIGCFNSCMNKNAVIEQDSSLCEVITSPVLRERCKDNVLMRKAITSSDVKFCNQMVDEKIKQACHNKLG